MSNNKIFIYVDGACKGNHDKYSDREGMCCVYIPEYDHKIIITSPTIRTNNEAEWQALIWGLVSSKYFIGKECVIYSDSQLVVNQFNKVFKVSNNTMYSYYLRATRIVRELENITVEWISRNSNLAGVILEEM